MGDERIKGPRARPWAGADWTDDELKAELAAREKARARPKPIIFLSPNHDLIEILKRLRAIH